jgi:hypothetical protein
MSQTISYPFTTTTNYTFDSNKIEVTGGVAQLKPINNGAQSFIQPFTSDTGFTYDATKTEFSGGLLQQVSQQPTNSLSWATYTTDINLNYGGGTLTGTATGGASIVGNKLDLTGDTVQYVDYDADLNADSQGVGAIKIKITPDYTGAPANDGNFFTITKNAGDADNLITLIHKTATGNLDLQINNTAGVTIINVTLGVWSPTSGTEYEFELNFDVTTGETRLFIDGIQFGATQVGTGARSAVINLLRIGSDVNGVNEADFKVADFIYFSTVQHTANYTPGYTLSDTLYVEDLVVLPSFTYPGVGVLQSFTTFTTTQTGAIRFNINGQYWNGLVWVASDDSYAQMNSPTDINAAIINLIGTDSVTLKLRTTDTNTLQDIDILTLGYIGQIYPTDNPTIEPITTFSAEGFDCFTTALTETDNDTITFTRKISGIEYYWTGLAWETSSGYSQSNTTVQMHTSGAFTGGDVSIVIYLHSSDGSITPSIDDLMIVYDSFTPPDELPSICSVTGYILDSNNQLLTDGTVTANPVIEGFITDKNWLVNLTPIQTSMDSTGRFELELVRSSEFRNTIKYNFTIIPTSSAIKPVRYYNITIPNSATADFNDIIATT